MKTCINNCCKIVIEKPKENNFVYSNINYNKKAGVLIYNNDKNTLLLVQSRGNFWGFPKGTIEKDEKVKDCALRELKEETGIILTKEDLHQCICINNKALYYIYDSRLESGSIQSQIKNNDVNGITWIKMSCLLDMLKNNKMKLNFHCKFLLEHFFNIKVFEKRLLN